MKKIQFDAKNHVYSLGSKRLPSATDRIKAFFEPFRRDYWANYIANRDGKTTRAVLEEWQVKRNWGSRVHSLIENHIKEDKPKEEEHPHEVREAINFLQSLSSTKLIPEKKVHSEEWEVAGTIDVIAETPEGVMIFDWKTSNKIRKDAYKQAKAPISHLGDCNYVKYALQLNLYKAMFEQQFGKKVIEIGFVKLAGEGSFEYFPVEDLTYEIDLMINHWKKKERVEKILT